MSEKDTGGYAFPWCGDLNETPFINLGLTVRDYFAAMAMAAIRSNVEFFREQQEIALEFNKRRDAYDIELEIARFAYQQADAMLRARGE